MDAPRKRRAAPTDDVPARTALDGLYRRYSGWLGGVLRRQLGGQAEAADDLVQETYIRIARYSDAETARHPRALLKQIGVNLARDHMRRHVVRGGLSSPAEIARGERLLAEQTTAADQEHALILKQVVLGLPPLYRDVFVLSRFTGLTYEEIARHLGIAIKTVEWRMSKALAICADRMRD